MAFQKKEWKNRLSEFPNRRRLEPTGIENTYDVVRAEGNVTEAGDAFAEESMNDLEERIAAGLAEGSITTATHTKTGTTHNLDVPVGAHNLTFLATADIADGDTWTVNSQPVTAVLQNGESLPGELFKAGNYVTGVYFNGAKLSFTGRGAMRALTIGVGNGGTSATYTGAAAVSITIPKLVVSSSAPSGVLPAGTIHGVY